MKTIIKKVEVFKLISAKGDFRTKITNNTEVFYIMMIESI